MTLKSRRLDRIQHVYFTALLVCLSLFAGTACQSLNSGQSQQEKKQTEILDAKKAVIVSYLNKGLPQMALKDLRESIAAHPQDADLKNLMGLAQLAIQNPNKAIGYFKDAYRIDPKVPIALNLSSAYIEAGEQAKAIELLLKLQNGKDSQSYPHPERISHNLGLAHERLGKIKQAEKYYVLALKDNSSFYLSLMRLGQLYDKSGRPKQARTQYQRAKETCDVCFDPVEALSKNFIAVKRADLAVSTLKKYMNTKDVTTTDKTRAQKLLSTAERVANLPTRSRTTVR